MFVRDSIHWVCPNFSLLLLLFCVFESLLPSFVDHQLFMKVVSCTNTDRKTFYHVQVRSGNSQFSFTLISDLINYSGSHSPLKISV